MMLLAALICSALATLQTETQTTTSIKRILTPNAKEKYTVTVAILDGSGGSMIDFTLELASPKKIEGDGPVEYEAKFRNELVRAAGRKKTIRDAGTAKVTLGPTGIPGNLLVKAQATALVLPLYGWTLPDAPGADGKFTLTGYTTDDGVKVDATGTVSVAKEAKVSIEWTFTDADKPYAKLSTVSSFDIKTGKLVRSEGQFSTKNGTAEFQVKASGR